MHHFPVITAALLASCITNVHAAEEVWVITDRAHALSNHQDALVTLLDEQQILEERLTALLPKSPQQAAKAFEELMASPEGRQLNQQLAKAQQAKAKAWSLGIDKVPAVVVDQRYVVYGEPNVQRALQLIEQARQ